MFRRSTVVALVWLAAASASAPAARAQGEPPPAPSAAQSPPPPPAQAEPPPAQAEPPPPAQAEPPPPPAQVEPGPAGGEPGAAPAAGAPAETAGTAVPAPSQPPPPPAPTQPPPASEALPHFEGQVEAGGETGETGETGEPSEPSEPDFASKAWPKPEHKPYPPFSIRIDPFNWLIEGRLGLELEVVAWKFISIEAVPVFIANARPPAFNFEGRSDPISQHSNGLGPIAGTSLGAGFWLSGKPLQGYVLRAYFTNYGLTYKASDGSGVFDRVKHTERQLVLFIGSHTRIGFFTLSGGIGLGYELNQQERCFVNRDSASVMAATSGCPDGSELQILLDRTGSQVADLNGGFHPIYVVGRFSLGVAFD